MIRRHIVTESEQREWLRLNVRAHRAAVRLTMTVAAERAGMHRRHWQKIEDCEVNVSLRTLSRVTMALGVDVVVLLREPAKPTPGIEMSSGSTEKVLRERLAVQVRALRVEQALTLKGASGRAGLCWRHWQKVEAGEVNATLQTLVRLALSLSVEPAELFSAP